MPNADLFNTTARRNFLATALALAAAPAFAHPQLPVVGEIDPATFVPHGPDLMNAFGTRAEWIARAPAEFATARLGAEVQRKTDAQVAAMMAVLDSESALDFIDTLFTLSERYAALARIAGGAALRCAATMAPTSSAKVA